MFYTGSVEVFLNEFFFVARCILYKFNLLCGILIQTEEESVYIDNALHTHTQSSNSLILFNILKQLLCTTTMYIVQLLCTTTTMYNYYVLLLLCTTTMYHYYVQLLCTTTTMYYYAQLLCIVYIKLNCTFRSLLSIGRKFTYQIISHTHND